LRELSATPIATDGQKSYRRENGAERKRWREQESSQADEVFRPPPAPQGDESGRSGQDAADHENERAEIAFAPDRTRSTESKDHLSKPERDEDNTYELEVIDLNHCRPLAYFFSSRFRIFPVGPFGSASTNSTMRGYL